MKSWVVDPATSRRYRLVAAAGGALGALGGGVLLNGETDGFATDFLYPIDSKRVALKTSGSTASYTINDFYQNAGTSPKQVYDVVGVLGWSPHNMCIQSQDFTIAGWVKETTTITVAATTAPDGTLTGSKLGSSNAAFGFHDILHNHGNIATIVGETYTWSIYAKAVEMSWIGIASENLNTATDKSFFNLATGALGTKAAAHSGYAISNVGGGWYRCSITFVATGTVNHHPKNHLGLADNQGGITPAAIGDGIYIWGAVFNRGSVPTAYLPTTTAARFGLALDYDPVTYAAKGLWSEPAATNLQVRSQEFDNAAWALAGCTIGANATTDIMGTSTADALIPNSGSNVVQFLNNVSFTVSTATAYTYSVFVKNGSLGNNWIELAPTTVATIRVWFNLATGAKGTSVGSPTDYTITSVGNGWYRITVTWTTNGTVFTAYNQAVGADASSAAITGNGTSPAFYLWGVQMELGTVATSYIPTFAATATRAGDSYSVTPASINYSATAGSWWFEHYQIGGVGTNPRMMVYSSGAYLYTTEVTAYGLNDGTILNKSPVPTITGNTQRVACAFQSGDRAITATGLAAATDAGSTTLLLAPGASITFGGSGGTTMRGYFRKLRYVPRRKTNSELVTETT